MRSPKLAVFENIGVDIGHSRRHQTAPTDGRTAAASAVNASVSHGIISPLAIVTDARSVDETGWPWRCCRRYRPAICRQHSDNLVGM
ncbi:hypothetical protein LNP56_28165 [Klebsiella pneumoniae subsp. pneumoniae]|nr:hypothetical protein [Klebsiella pneumoniae subsp. pneumoniae]